MSGNAGGQRPYELQDWLNRRLYHPLSWRLAQRLKGTWVTPNMVSVSGVGCMALAAAAYTWPAGIAAAVLGLLLHMSWHVVDGADGDLARITGQSSPMGEVVDGACDYGGHLILYISLGAVLAEDIGNVAWAIMLAAGIPRAVQTNYFEVQRRQYQWWAYGVPWLRISNQSAATQPGVLGRLTGVYLALGNATATGGMQIDALRAEADDKMRERISAAAKAEYASLLTRMSILSSNYRTLGIGVSMMLGSPLHYFIFEAVFLSLYCVWLIPQSSKAVRNIIDQVSPNTSR